MTVADDDFADFGRLIDALRPWLGQLVIVGGWSHRLHRLHDWATAPAYAPLRTRDADIAFSLTHPPRGDLRAALESANFRESLSGEDRPPIAEYRFGDDDAGFFAEFLAPLGGSGVRRDGASDATVVRAGVTAQKLRYLEVLLIRPWIVRLAMNSELRLATSTDIRVANPVTFIAQKLLIRKSRKPGKRAQDVLYIHDTLELFGRRRDELRALWSKEIRPMLGTKLAGRIERLQRELFATVDDVIREAARVPVDRSLTAERVRSDCAYGLAEIFGPA